MFTDPIADYLTRVRNAQMAGHKVVNVPASNMKKSITEILHDKGYILDYKMLSEEGNKTSFSVNLTHSFLNTGCFVFPEKKTCISNLDWSTPIENVSYMKVHFEWWAKAGGGPGYGSEIEKDVYIKNYYLRDYELCFCWNGTGRSDGVANIIKNSGSYVPGKFYRKNLIK